MTAMYYSEASLDDVDFATPMSLQPKHLGHPTTRSGFGSLAEIPDANDESDDNLDDGDSDSTGNYSPPAWRRLENGDRWYGNWRNGSEVLVHRALNRSIPFNINYDPEVFEAARRTRLPTGSLSPEKGRSPEPEIRGRIEDDILTKIKAESVPPIKEEVVSEPMEDIKQSRITSMSPSPSKDNCKYLFIPFVHLACSL